MVKETQRELLKQQKAARQQHAVNNETKATAVASDFDDAPEESHIEDIDMNILTRNSFYQTEKFITGNRVVALPGTGGIDTDSWHHQLLQRFVKVHQAQLQGMRNLHKETLVEVKM